MILTGNCLDILPTLEADSIQCCVTSPPYYGLRDYGTATWEGGDPGCDHIAPKKGGTGESSALQLSVKRVDFESGGQFREVCGKCGATRIDSQIGLEPTPEAYVGKLVQVFREVRRVLRDDGTLWLNLGDSYAQERWGKGTAPPPTNTGNKAATSRTRGGAGLKPKDLIGIPWRVAFALQADRWYLRQDIIWNKPNPMPESVTDRCTKAHEYIFLLTKSARYFMDMEAVKIKGAGNKWGRYHNPKYGEGSGGRMQSAKEMTAAEYIEKYQSCNRRSVWTITTKPFKEAHFATFPPEIPEICIKAGSKRGDTILDPFSGAGTTGNVAERLGRKYIGIELNSAYSEMAEKRIDAARLPLLEGL
jgi:DNA modification methylase